MRCPECQHEIQSSESYKQGIHRKIECPGCRARLQWDEVISSAGRDAIRTGTIPCGCPQEDSSARFPLTR